MVVFFLSRWLSVTVFMISLRRRSASFFMSDGTKHTSNQLLNSIFTSPVLQEICHAFSRLHNTAFSLYVPSRFLIAGRAHLSAFVLCVPFRFFAVLHMLIYLFSISVGLHYWITFYPIGVLRSVSVEIQFIPTFSPSDACLAIFVCGILSVSTTFSDTVSITSITCPIAISSDSVQAYNVMPFAVRKSI